MNVKFYRGLKASYNSTTHANGIYFATDSKEIYMNGGPYTGSLNELISTVSGINEDIVEINNALANKVEKASGKSLVADEKIALIDTNASQIASIQQELESLSGGAGSIQTQISNAIGELDANITSEEGGKVRVQVVESNGKITAVNVTESDIASHATLVEVKGKVDAFFAGADMSETVDQYIDTLKELQTYIESDAAAAITMTDAIAEAKDAAAEADRKAVAAQGEVDALEAVVAGKVDQGAYDKKIAELAAADGTTLNSAKTHAQGLINGLNLADNEVEGQYVSKVNQTNGQITVERKAIPTYTLATGSANGTVSFNGKDVAVKGLGSAAYTSSDAYATAEQGGKAVEALTLANSLNAALTWEIIE